MPTPKDYTVDPFSQYYAHSLDLRRVDQMPAPGTTALSLAAVYQKFLTSKAFVIFFSSDNKQRSDLYINELLALQTISQEDRASATDPFAKALATYHKEVADAKNTLDRVLVECRKQAVEQKNDQEKQIAQKKKTEACAQYDREMASVAKKLWQETEKHMSEIPFSMKAELMEILKLRNIEAADIELVRDAILLKAKKEALQAELAKSERIQDLLNAHPLTLLCENNEVLTTNEAVFWTLKDNGDEKSGPKEYEVNDLMGAIFSYVKVLFPITPIDPSDSSEIFLSRGDVEQIQANRDLYETILFNFAVLMKYYGFRFSMQKDGQGKYRFTLLEPKERPWWVQEMIEDDFNCIQRILRSMTILGFSGIAKILLETLKRMSWQVGVSIRAYDCAEWAKAMTPIDITSLPQAKIAILDTVVLRGQYEAVLQKIIMHRKMQKKNQGSWLKRTFSALDPLKIKMVEDLYAVLCNQQKVDTAYDVAQESHEVLCSNLLAAAEIARGYLFAGEGLIGKDKVLSQLAYDILAAQRAVLSPEQEKVQENEQPFTVVAARHV